MSGPLPTGVVTLVLGDLERSVDLWENDRESMTAAMGRVDQLVDEVTARFGGVQPTEQGEGDNFVVAFERVTDAVAGACEIQRRFATERWPGDLQLRFRIGVHTGEIGVDATNRYQGPTINRCARIRDLAHGGQTLLSGATVVLVPDAMPEGATTRSLGVHELRGMSRPEDLHQLCHPDLDDTFPIIPSSVTTNLPTPASTFVGRSGELAELRGLIATSRVVTIAGAGGSGKSRLAVEFARGQTPSSSTWLAELAWIRDPLLVPRAVADAVQAELAGEPDPVAAIIRKLRRRPSLLVVDNCEHLLDASAGLVSTLVMACPDLAVVSTSREPLGIDGEVIWRIPSLSMADAITLFVDRARRAAPSFEITEATAGPIAEICQRVDRLPLAIELAAARCRALSVEQIAAGLHERFRLLTGGARDALPRQRSLEASVAWSYDLLPDAERTVLTRLSVFPGSFSLEGATVVCAGGLVQPEQVLDTISSLVDRSLVRVEQDGGQLRYGLLETIRAYARERLTELDDPDAVRDRHLDFAMQLASSGGIGLAGDIAQWLRWAPILRAELDNLRSAIEWAGSSGRPERVIDLIGDLQGFWETENMQGEISRAVLAVLSSDALTPRDRARGLVLVATIAFALPVAFDFANEACALARAVGDSDAIRARAIALRAYTGFFLARGTNEQIAADIEAARAEAARAEPAEAVALLGYVGAVQVYWSGADDGRATLEQAIRIAQEHRLADAELSARAHLLHNFTDGRVQAFRDNAQAVMASARAIGADVTLTATLQIVGFMECLSGHERAAREHVDEALDVMTRVGSAIIEYFPLRADALVELRFGDPRLALTKALDALERAHQMGLGVNEHIDEWMVGAAARRAGNPDQAREHLETALALSIDPRMPLVAGRAHLELALVDLAEDDVERAWQHGHDALKLLAAAGDGVGAFDALDVIAAVAARSNTAEMAARLLGAADSCRHELDLAPFTVTGDERQRLLDDLATELEDVEDVRAEGARLTYEDAVAYARRGRGERNRPTTGWQSLTPTEVDVVRLVADGLQNGQIAEQLLISVNTVKSHLSHAYTKLGISGRTQLAAEVTGRLKSR